jgi:hypothetical protein
MSWTPEQLAWIRAHQRAAVPTWFGTILFSLGIPRRFFPWRWIISAKRSKAYDENAWKAY